MADKEALIEQLFDIISSMEEEGLLDFHFRVNYSLNKEASDPYHFAELLSNFCSDAQITIRDMTSQVLEQSVNYQELEELSLKIKGGSLCLGVCLMADACGALCEAVDERSKEKCVGAVEAIKTEYLRVQDKINNIAQQHQPEILQVAHLSQLTENAFIGHSLLPGSAVGLKF
ncbi:hypothetical protein Ddye_029059 [Dipteronia dyeriana]|uniref:Histidine-containing phosphotransfer protein n=1 Tax=Dipteronia dyeriana TaxID=168575 RepID=A0AAD9TDV3_9ROSI|nr:hypothetical protein Ddye_029059 [Dipteronia dyeriana]